MKVQLVSLMCFILVEASSQKLNPENFYFAWKPNPTDFIIANHEKYLSGEEYRKLLDCTGLAFDAEVDLKTNEIISVKYSFVSTLVNAAAKSSNLDQDIAIKVSKILLDNIGLTKVKSIDGRDVPEGVVKFLITLDFTIEDKDKFR